MFQHAYFGQRTGPSVPVPLVLLLQSLCRAGRRASGGAGTAGTAVLENGDLDLDDHSQGLKTSADDHNNDDATAGTNTTPSNKCAIHSKYFKSTIFA